MEKQASASVLISMDEAKLIETDLTSLDYSNCGMQILYRIQKRLDAVVNKWYPFIMETSVGMPSPDRNDRQTRIVRKGTIVGIKSDIYCEGSSVSISVNYPPPKGGELRASTQRTCLDQDRTR